MKYIGPHEYQQERSYPSPSPSPILRPMVVLLLLIVLLLLGLYFGEDLATRCKTKQNMALGCETFGP